MEELFAPFPADTFPTKLHLTELLALLNAPYAAKVPVPPSTFQAHEDMYPDLFRPDATVTAEPLRDRLVGAWRQKWPRGVATDFLYTSFWDQVGYELPEFVGSMVGPNIVLNR